MKRTDQLVCPFLLSVLQAPTHRFLEVEVVVIETSAISKTISLSQAWKTYLVSNMIRARVAVDINISIGSKKIISSKL